ncbi:hypothetical protein CYMTET_9272 [Cymbomonas tetramitiformis]|uniref:Secreted protein n=1 Tax=Cymbomonas tetramitiformis TaxID=36881 RepID=A0AAE0GRU6_9CHLO|nr:hypothetical protein CYMTET_9272 [Cymbomonas tetramitiformis]
MPLSIQNCNNFLLVCVLGSVLNIVTSVGALESDDCLLFPQNCLESELKTRSHISSRAFHRKLASNGCADGSEDVIFVSGKVPITIFFAEQSVIVTARLCF